MARTMMKLVLAMLFLLAAACSGADNSRVVRGWEAGQATFVDTDGDGLPDERVDAKGGMGKSTLVDTNGDGLPDTRINKR